MPAAAAVGSAPNLAICGVQQAVLRIGEFDVSDVVGGNGSDSCPALACIRGVIQCARISADPDVIADSGDRAETEQPATGTLCQVLPESSERCTSPFGERLQLSGDAAFLSLAKAISSEATRAPET